MRILSFLLTILLLSHPAFGYFVVLKSGKQIEGTRIAEDQATIQLKDSAGDLLSFRKDTLDLDRMMQLNAGFRNDVIVVSETKTASRLVSIVEIAEQTRKQRKGTARLLTDGDVSNLPEVSVFGGPEISGKTTVAHSTQESEQAWRNDAARLKREISLLRERHLVAASRCETARTKAAGKMTSPHRRPESLLLLMDTPVDCERSDEAERRLREAERRWYELEERARKSGVPWSWLD